MSVCDESIVAEMISDFSIAVNEKDYVKAYRIIKLLRDYLKGKKCEDYILERAMRILNSLEAQVNEEWRKVIDDAKNTLLKSAKKRKRSTKKKTSKTRSRRSRRRRKR